MTAMFKEMKRSLLRMYAQNQGYNTTQKQLKTHNTIVADKAQQMREYGEEKIAKWESDGDGDSYFFPDYWLAFLLCSLPMQMYFPRRKLWLDCLVPPDLTVASISMLAVPVVKTKAIRREERKSVLDLINDEKRGSQSDNHFIIYHKREPDRLGPLDESLNVLRDELDTLRGNLRLLTALEHGGLDVKAAADKISSRIVEVVRELTTLLRLRTDQVLKRGRQSFIAPLSLEETYSMSSHHSSSSNPASGGVP